MPVRRLDISDGFSLKEQTEGARFEIITDVTSFRLELLEPERGIALVFPVESGQENVDSIEATSRIASMAINGATIGPRIMPIEGAEGDFEWGDLREGEELVFQNERNGCGTLTYTGQSIHYLLTELTE